MTHSQILLTRGETQEHSKLALAEGGAAQRSERCSGLSVVGDACKEPSSLHHLGLLSPTEEPAEVRSSTDYERHKVASPDCCVTSSKKLLSRGSSAVVVVCCELLTICLLSLGRLLGNRHPVGRSGEEQRAP